MVVTPCYRLSTLSISNIPNFPVEDFFKVPFTHHSAIISGPKETSARFYYIHRTVEEHLSVKKLRQLIKEDAYHSQGHMPNNFTRTINNTKEARRAVEMFKDEYLLDFINVEEIGEREKIDVDERVIETKHRSKHQEFHYDLWQRLCFHRQPMSSGDLWC